MPRIVEPQVFFQASMAMLNVLVTRAGGKLEIRGEELGAMDGMGMFISVDDNGVFTFNVVDTRVKN